jgi:hypothetical protein
MVPSLANFRRAFFSYIVERSLTTSRKCWSSCVIFMKVGERQCSGCEASRWGLWSDPTEVSFEWLKLVAPPPQSLVHVMHN